MLKLGLKLKLILEILFYVMAAIFILLCIFMFYKYRKSQNAGKDETLLPSNNGETKIDGQVLK